MSNAGTDLAKMREKIEHICPLCGKTFMAIRIARACKQCSPHARYLRQKAKNQIEGGCKVKTEELKAMIAEFDDRFIADCLVYIAKNQTVDHSRSILEEAAKRLEQHAK